MWDYGGWFFHRNQEFMSVPESQLLVLNIDVISGLCFQKNSELLAVYPSDRREAINQV